MFFLQRESKAIDDAGEKEGEEQTLFFSRMRGEEKVKGGGSEGEGRNGEKEEKMTRSCDKFRGRRR